MPSPRNWNHSFASSLLALSAKNADLTKIRSLVDLLVSIAGIIE